jgi:hypothetical protein
MEKWPVKPTVEMTILIQSIGMESERFIVCCVSKKLHRNRLHNPIRFKIINKAMLVEQIKSATLVQANF